MSEFEKFHPQEENDLSQESALDRELDRYAVLHEQLANDPNNQDLQKELSDTHVRLDEFSVKTGSEESRQMIENLLNKERVVAGYANYLFDQFEKWQSLSVMLENRALDDIEKKKYSPEVMVKLDTFVDRWMNVSITAHDVYDQVLQGTELESRMTLFDNRDLFVRTVIGLSREKIMKLIMACLLELEGFEEKLKEYNSITGESINADDIIPRRR